MLLKITGTYIIIGICIILACLLKYVYETRYLEKIIESFDLKNSITIHYYST